MIFLPQVSRLISLSKGHYHNEPPASLLISILATKSLRDIPLDTYRVRGSDHRWTILVSVICHRPPNMG